MTLTKSRTATGEILLAEDSPTQAQELAHVLNARGYRVATAANGREALSLVRARRSDIVLADVLMPEMDGYALCEAIKSDRDLSDVPVILLTSLGSPNDVIRGLECGADNFIRKPWDQSQLLDRIATILASRRIRPRALTKLGVELVLSGQRHFITSDRQQMLDFLLSSYEEIAQAHDLLELKREELERTLSDLRGVLEATPDGIVMADRGGNLRILNRAAQELLTDVLGDLPPGAPLPPTMRELGTLLAERTTDPHDYTKRFAALLTNSEDKMADECQIVGSGRHILRLSAPVRRSSGEIIGRVLIFRDITAQREAERLKSELVATVSHELRAPLGCVLGYAELLAQPDLDDATRRRYLDLIRSERRRLTALINDFLDLHRIESGSFAPSIETIDLRPLLTEQLHLFSRQSDRHALNLDLGDEPLVVLADRDRIAQVATNLLSNALKYSPAGGRIVLRAHRAHDVVRVSVTDSGLGIPADQQPCIFTKFFRVHSTATRDIGGTGLGLALCKELIDAHAGRIGFQSTEGEGSTFWFELPAE